MRGSQALEEGVQGCIVETIHNVGKHREHDQVKEETLPRLEHVERGIEIVAINPAARWRMTAETAVVVAILVGGKRVSACVACKQKGEDGEKNTDRETGGRWRDEHKGERGGAVAAPGMASHATSESPSCDQ